MMTMLKMTIMMIIMSIRESVYQPVLIKAVTK